MLVQKTPIKSRKYSVLQGFCFLQTQKNKKKQIKTNKKQKNFTKKVDI